MTECPTADSLGAMIAGTLSESARAEIANHAAACEPCHTVIESLVEHARAASTLDDAPESDVELALRPGVQVGRYVIDARLGAGGMGVVYAATDSELQRRVALKLLHPGRDDNGSVGRERLLREARTLARLSHPNVVTVFDVGRHHGHVFVAMELIEGGSLTAWLGRGSRRPDAICARMIEAGRGLAAAHSAGVVHRDVKPDNILVGLDDRARVTDFGLARLGELPPDHEQSACSPQLGVLTRTGTLMGTPAYMAPEQLLRGETNAMTDQWSFCATLYEAVSGVRPFTVDDLHARMSAIDEGRLATPRHRVPPRIRRIALRGLSADPKARWPSIDAVVKALERRPPWRYFAVATLAVAAIAGGVALTRETPPKPAAFPGWVDQRTGCTCPLSACKDGCVSVCRTTGYTIGEKLPGLDVIGRQEALLGAAADGNTLLYLAGERCNLDRLFVAHRRGPAFVPVDITDQVDRRFAIHEGCCTLSADAQTVILVTADHTGFGAVRLDGTRLLPTTESFDVTPGLRGTVRHPVLAADQLALYFKFDEPSAEPGEVGPLDGNYVVERPDRRSAFGSPRRLKGQAKQYEYVTGISSDGLSLFMMYGFETFVLVRSSKADAFGSPGPWMFPAKLPGFRAVPLDDCRRIITTTTPGGCRNEAITYLEGE